MVFHTTEYYKQTLAGDLFSRSDSDYENRSAPVAIRRPLGAESLSVLIRTESGSSRYRLPGKTKCVF